MRYFTALFLLISLHAAATDRIPVLSGNWSSLVTWGGFLPGNGDKVIVPSGKTITVDVPAVIDEINVSQGATLTWSNASVLTVNSRFIVDGTVVMNGGNITIPNAGRDFYLNGGSSFTWDPGNNTAAGATLFTNSAEMFSNTSTLIIKKWYNYSVALGSVVNGDFGNLTMNSLNSSNLIAEWNQNNQFQSHKIRGTLTVDQGWITLDKSGSISNTSIGGVVLNSANSSFYAHNGNHNSAFTLNIGSVTNNGGNFIGLSDGNGNITLNVSGGFTTSGNVKVINNTGVAGVSNGDAIFNVGGLYMQTGGDSRIIYNVSSTNSGTFTALFNSLTVDGGIFMAQTGCHTAGKEAKFEITGNMVVAFMNPTDKFRIASLTSIGTTLNNIIVRFKVGGNLTKNGFPSTEFTTSASTGQEFTNINGTLTVNSGNFNFNYGTTACAHTVTTTIGNITIVGGNTWFSRNGGTATINVPGTFLSTGGNAFIRGDVGTADFYVNQFNETGGNVILHNNSAIVTPDQISVIVTGSFTQTGGILNFDSNVNGGQQHVLKINCPTYTIGGNGLITRAGAGTSSVFGLIYYNRGGTVEFYRNSNSHQVQQVKQVVQNATLLDVIAGNVQISGGHAGTDYFTVSSGATLNMRNSQFQTSNTSLSTGIQVAEGGTLKLYRTYGLYDGTINAALNSGGNMDYFLDANSIVEYNGINSQVLTGTGVGNATKTWHKYGILRINFSGTDGVKYVYPVASNVFVRTRLELQQGELNLNGYTVTLENGQPDAVSRTAGYMLSEQNLSLNASQMAWQNIQTGDHEFPFGYNANTYLPVTINPLSGIGNTVTISTRGTGSGNLPLPYTIAQAVLSQPAQLSPALDSTKIVINGTDVSNSKVLDRWWEIRSVGTESAMEANVTLTYRGSENTLDPSQANSTMGAINWTGYDWGVRQILGTGTTSGTGTVTIPRLSTFGTLGVMSYISALPIELVSFTACLQGSEVALKWTTATEINNDYFTVERSSDGQNFDALEKIPGAGNSHVTRNYSTTDKAPLPGTSYYRLKQTDFDGKYTYSSIETVKVGNNVAAETFSIQSVSPSPFDDSFVVEFQAERTSEVYFRLASTSGQLIKEEKIQAHSGRNEYRYSDGSAMQKGAYVVTLAADGKTISRKIIKR